MRFLLASQPLRLVRKLAHFLRQCRALRVQLRLQLGVLLPQPLQLDAVAGALVHLAALAHQPLLVGLNVRGGGSGSGAREEAPPR
jgi:hypothetical protein